MGNVTSLELEPVLITCRSCGGPILAAPPLTVNADAVPGAPLITIRSRSDIPDAVALRIDRCLACADRDAGDALRLAGYGAQAEQIRQLAGLDHAGAHATLQLIVQCFTDAQLKKRLPVERGVTLGTWVAWCHADALIAGGELLPDLPLSVWLPDPHDGPQYAMVGIAEVWQIEDVPAVLIELPGLDGSGEWQSRFLPASNVGTVSHAHRARLQACAELLRRTRRPGRPKGTTLYRYDEVARMFRDATSKIGRSPRSIAEFTRTAGLSPDTFKRNLKAWNTTWPRFRDQNTKDT